MLSRTSTEIRPAAALRRRFCRPGGVLLALLAGAACGAPPAVDDAPARAAVERASALVRAQQPDEGAELHRLALLAEAASRTAVTHPRSSTARQRAQQAWLEAAAEASRQARRVRRRETAELARWRALQPLAGARVAEAAHLLEGPGMGAPEAAAVSQAQTQLGLARRLARAGELPGAIAAAERALAHAALPVETWRAQHQRLTEPDQVRAWRRQRDEAVAASRRGRSSLIVVDKLHRDLLLYRAGRIVGTWPVELGVNGLARKRHAGDRATPEGLYKVVRKKEGAATRYHRALLIDYPNAEDLRRLRTARAAGEVPSGVAAGSLIEIHGRGGSGRDWTDGCVALADADMDALYRQVAAGTPVLIVGSL